MELFSIFYTYLLLEWYIIRRISKVFRKVDFNQKKRNLESGISIYRKITSERYPTTSSFPGRRWHTI